MRFIGGKLNGMVCESCPTLAKLPDDGSLMIPVTLTAADPAVPRAVRQWVVSHNPDDVMLWERYVLQRGSDIWRYEPKETAPLRATKKLKGGL